MRIEGALGILSFLPAMAVVSFTVSAAAAPAIAGDIPFAPSLDVAAGSVTGVTQTAIGDLNGDGLPDIGVFEGGKHASGVTFAWFEAPTWTRHDFHPGLEPGPFVGAASFADIDGDGQLDVVVSSDLHSGGTITGSLYWFQNPGGAASGPWARHRIVQNLADTEHINDIGIADMDGDGLLDVVIRHLGSTSKVRILFQDTPDSWTLRTLPVRAREGLKLADLDRDGHVDILLNGFWWAAPVDPRTGAFTEYLIDNAYYSLPVTGLNNSVKIGVGDLDGDGLEDVVFSVAEGAPVYLAWFKAPSNPRTEAWSRTIIEPGFTNGHQAELGDMDGDGDLDLVNGLSFGSTGVFIYVNLDHGMTWAKQMLTTGLGMYSGVIGDIGADGDLDIVGGNTYAGSARPWLHENLSAHVMASAHLRNGTGVNPVCFTSSPPVLGAPWTAEVDTTKHPGAIKTILFGYASPATGPVMSYGEVLVDTSSGFLYESSTTPDPTSGIARHADTIPNMSSLLGLNVSLQGVILGGGLELTNAADLVLGF